MVKNYLVSAVRPIKTKWMDKQGQDLHKNYLTMYEMSLASFRRLTQEPFESILWTEPADDNEQCNRMNWQAIRDLWQSEPCNIFWAGADTFMTKSTSVFSDRFKEYRLFNYTDPKSHPDFAHYFNDDIQYYPHTMDDRTWKIGENLWKYCQGHPEQQWGFDQLRHNSMFWAQDIPEEDRCYPEMAYQAFALRGDPNAIPILNKWNGIDINDAHILHFHASRGSDRVIALMKDLCKRMGITV
jgi:hypothetical protein